MTTHNELNPWGGDPLADAAATYAPAAQVDPPATAPAPRVQLSTADRYPQHRACSVCGAPDATPRIGHLLPFCGACEREWAVSEEQAQAATARTRFVARRRRERGL